MIKIRKGKEERSVSVIDYLEGFIDWEIVDKKDVAIVNKVKENLINKYGRVFKTKEVKSKKDNGDK